VLDSLQRAREAAGVAVTAAEDGEAALADEWLATVVSRLQAVREQLAAASQGGYDDAAVAAIDPRTSAAIDRANAAIDADL